MIAVLAYQKNTLGLPKAITVDIDPVFISQSFDDYDFNQWVKLKFILPLRPTDDAYIESFNVKFRIYHLNQNWYASLEYAKYKNEVWKTDYNWVRPHRSLKNQTQLILSRVGSFHSPCP